MGDQNAYVGPPYIRSDAARKTRLINFDTSYKARGFKLHLQHTAELDRLLAFVSQTSSFSCWIVGYASKKGNSDANLKLSGNRALAVEKYLVSKNSLFGDEDRIAIFDFHGDKGYIAGKTDDSADERAVEVHIFLGNPKPPPPPTPVVPKPKPPLPGGPRYMQWQVASPGGVTITAPIGGGFNVWFIRNSKTGETRGYLQPVAALGVSISLSGIAAAWQIVQSIITGGAYSAPDFSDVTAPTPVTFEEVEACLVRVTGGGAALVYGANAAIVTFDSGGVYVYATWGEPVKQPMQLWQFVNAGSNWGLGAGLQTATGPLVKVAS